MMKKRKPRKPPFREGSLEYDIFVYFYKMNVRLSKQQVIDAKNRLLKAEQNNTYFKELDMIGAEHKAKKENYYSNIAEELRAGRELEQFRRVDLKGGCKRRVKISQYTEEGEYIKTFDSVSDASVEMTDSKVKGAGTIANCAKGRQNLAYNYIWQYEDE